MSSAIVGLLMDGTHIIILMQILVLVLHLSHSRINQSLFYICSILVTCLGILSCFLSAFVYPTLLFKLNIPIPIVSIFAGIIQSELIHVL